jgi:4-hydroxy-tetrahydrodipicolinate synthase
MLYNVPSRTSLDMDPRVAREIGERAANVVALKEANAAHERVRTVVETSGLVVFCGEDRAIADFMQHGAAGSVSVVGNVLPGEVAELVRCARPGGDSARAAELVEYLAPLVRDLFIEVNPVPVKAALACLSRCREEVRLPLAPLEDASRAKLEATLRASGVVSSR